MSQDLGYDPEGGIVGFKNTYRFPSLQRTAVSIFPPSPKIEVADLCIHGRQRCIWITIQESVLLV